MNQPKAAVIINSFNRLELLRECLGTLTAAVKGAGKTDEFVVVVYEAGSTDGSLEWLQTDGQRLDLRVDVLVPGPGDDTSFAAGLNTAAACAAGRYPRLQYLIFYETDNQFLGFDPVYRAIFRLLAREDLGACGFTVRHHDGSPAGTGQPFPTLLNFLLGKNLVSHFDLEALPYRWEVQTDGTVFSEADVVYTSPLVVKLEAWKDSGGLDAATFPFSDCDVDWARRMRDLGWKMGVIRTGQVIHDNRNALSAWSRFRAMDAHRGRLRYFMKHRPWSVYLVWPLLLIVRHACELISIPVVVRERQRQQRLFGQFWNLLKSCPKSYE